MSTMALAVSTETSNWSAFTVSPALTCHWTISASCRPSPRSGSLKYFIAVLRFRRARDTPALGVIQRCIAGRQDVVDPGQVQRLQTVQRRRDVRRGDPLDRPLAGA